MVLEVMPNGGWVLEVDIRSFFDTIDHSVLRRFLDERVTDGVLCRAIDKWLRAGVLEEGAVTHPDRGTLSERWRASPVPRRRGRLLCTSSVRMVEAP